MGKRRRRLPLTMLPTMEYVAGDVPIRKGELLELHPDGKVYPCPPRPPRATCLRDVAEETVAEAKIDKIIRKLTWYENLPSDAEIVRLVKRWRAHDRRLRQLRIQPTRK